MKRGLLLIVIVMLALMGARGTSAQGEVNQLDDLVVELWPDYDRAAMLVLLTGTLPESATLPATVVLPLPADAELHAIARFADDGSALISDVESSDAGGLLTLTTPARRFRVEYYQPYDIDGDRRSFRFDWTSDLTIANAAAIVQQPLAATDMTIVPEPVGSTARNDGLNYFQLPAQPVAAGEPFTVDVSYTMTEPALSAPPATPAAAAAPANDPNPLTQWLSTIPSWVWLLTIPLIVALLVGAWLLGRRQGNSRTRKPRPTRPGKAVAAKAPPAAARFCHRCGQQAQPDDVFCRKCGAQLK